MIDGFRLTMTGAELRTRLDERIARHRWLVEHYRREARREPDPNVEDDFVTPEHQCEYEQELHEWRADVLGYIRDHVEPGEVYRLGRRDMEFGELLPEKPGSVEQEEYEREQRIGFSMERIAKGISGFSSGIAAIAEALAARDTRDARHEL